MRNKQTWIFGDVHGCYIKLKQCLDSIDLQKGDRIIGLGDYCDRGNSTYQVVELLLSLEQEYDCKWIKGNHDDCFFKGLHDGKYLLMNQGCRETIDSYIRNCDEDKEIIDKLSGSYTTFELGDMPPEHYGFWRNLLPYFIDENNNCFVHGGFNRHHLISDSVYNNERVFLWDRDLLGQARSYSSMKDNEYEFKIKDNFNHVFVGHTPVQYFDSEVPLTYSNITVLDCGAGKFEKGTVCIMNLETREFKQF